MRGLVRHLLFYRKIKYSMMTKLCGHQATRSFCLLLTEVFFVNNNYININKDINKDSTGDGRTSVSTWKHFHRPFCEYSDSFHLHLHIFCHRPNVCLWNAWLVVSSINTTLHKNCAFVISFIRTYKR